MGTGHYYLFRISYDLCLDVYHCWNFCTCAITLTRNDPAKCVPLKYRYKPHFILYWIPNWISGCVLRFKNNNYVFLFKSISFFVLARRLNEIDRLCVIFKSCNTHVFTKQNKKKKKRKQKKKWKYKRFEWAHHNIITFVHNLPTRKLHNRKLSVQSVFTRAGSKRNISEHNWIWMDVIRNGYVEFLVRTASLPTTQSADKRREKSKISRIYSRLSIR